MWMSQQCPNLWLTLCFSSYCRFVSRILVVPDHAELLLSSSGVRTSFRQLCAALRACQH